jgi:hypothetical protein
MGDYLSSIFADPGSAKVVERTREQNGETTAGRFGFVPAILTRLSSRQAVKLRTFQIGWFGLLPATA